METGEGDQGDSELSEVGVELIGKAEAASNTGESRGDQVVKYNKRQKVCCELKLNHEESTLCKRIVYVKTICMIS